MGEIAIPVLLSFFLGPGMGQFYNREYRKGGYLVAVSLLVLCAAFAWFRQAAMPYLPVDLQTVDKAALQSLMENAVNHVVSGHGEVFYTYEFILTALWLYSVVDAWRGALRRKSLPSRPGQ